MTKRVYIDTSVVGEQFDKEFSANTMPFFEAVTKGLFIVIISDLLEAELLRAPQLKNEELVNEISKTYLESRSFI